MGTGIGTGDIRGIEYLDIDIPSGTNHRDAIWFSLPRQPSRAASHWNILFLIIVCLQLCTASYAEQRIRLLHLFQTTCAMHFILLHAISFPITE